LTLRPGRELALRAKGDTASTAPIGPPPHPEATQLVYPLHLRERGQEGEVIAHFVIDSAGRVVRPTVQIARSTNSGFTEVVRSYLEKVEFEPARLDRRPVCALVRDWPFRFSLAR
jgi:TonB family protein